MDPLAQAKRAKWWLTAAGGLVLFGFTAAVTWGKLARASDVEDLKARMLTNEQAITDEKSQHETERKFIRWLVKAIWSMHPDVPPPPAFDEQ